MRISRRLVARVSVLGHGEMQRNEITGAVYAGTAMALVGFSDAASSWLLFERLSGQSEGT
jgi:hypothetical protein